MNKVGTASGVGAVVLLEVVREKKRDVRAGESDGDRVAVRGLLSWRAGR